MNAKQTKTSKQLLQRFSDLIRDNLGIYFKEESLDNLENKLIPMATALGHPSLEESLERILNEPLNEEIKSIIAHYVTIGETYFFRDSNIFHLLEHKILPKLIAERWDKKEIKIWSSACCSGEEIYSIAIILNKLIPNIQEWNIQLIGTDINKQFLKKAELGQYSPWSFRAVSKQLIQRCFTRVNERSYSLKPQIKRLVKFIPLNLIEPIPAYLEPMLAEADIIFACNVLYYFSAFQIKKVIDMLQAHLINEGLLIVSAVEAPLVKNDLLQEEIVDGSIIFRKTPKVIQSHRLRTTDVKTVRAQTKASVPQPILAKLKEVAAQDTGNETDELTTILSHIHKGESQAALSLCTAALENDATNAKLYYTQATLLQDKGNVMEAIKALEKAIFFDPSFIMAHFMLGNLLAASKQKAEASKRFTITQKLLSKLDSNQEVYGSEGLKAADIETIINETKERL